jgi:hypothetical protein
VEEVEIIHQHQWYGRDAVVKTKDGSYAKACFDYKDECFKLQEEYNPRYWDVQMIFRFNGVGGIK